MYSLSYHEYMAEPMVEFLDVKGNPTGFYLKDWTWNIAYEPKLKK